MVCRFLLAIPESMYGPAVPLYLSYFYPRERLGLRVGIFLSGSALANVYGGALAYGISQARGAIAPWRILFLVEGNYNISLIIWTLDSYLCRPPYYRISRRGVFLDT